MHFKTQGIIIKELEAKRNDRYLTILTDSHGKINAVARGAKSYKSKLFACTSQFTYGNFEIFKNKDIFVIDEVDAIETFYPLRENLCALSMAQYFCEVAQTVCTFEENSDTHYKFISLLANSFYYLTRDNCDFILAKSVFEMKCMCLAGYMPAVSECAGCLDACNEGAFFSISDSCIYCKSCESKGFVAATRFLSADVLKALNHICNGPFKKMFSFNLNDYDKKILMDICEKYMLSILEAKFKSLDFLKSVL